MFHGCLSADLLYFDTVFLAASCANVDRVSLGTPAEACVAARYTK